MSEQQPPPVPRPVEEPSTAVPPAPMIISLIIHGLVLVGILFVLIVIVPKFQEIFKSFGAELPSLTAAVLEVSRLARAYGFLLPVVVVGFLTVDGLVYWQIRRNFHPIWCKLWSGFVTLLEGIAVLAIMLSVFMALTGLMAHVSS